MKSLKDILAVVVGILAAIGAICYFYKFVTEPPDGRSRFGMDRTGFGGSCLCLWPDLFPRPR